MKILFISLGCDKNLVDTEMMLGELLQKGYEFTDDEAEAEIVVVNTCCFIGDAKELERRLVGRGTETPEVIAKRLSRASEESEGIEAYDYIVVNDDLEECVKQLHSIVINAHYAPNRCAEFINQIREELKEFSKGAN